VAGKQIHDANLIATMLVQGSAQSLHLLNRLG
jgi:hypothetical protein